MYVKKIKVFLRSGRAGGKLDSWTACRGEQLEQYQLGCKILEKYWQYIGKVLRKYWENIKENFRKISRKISKKILGWQRGSNFDNLSDARIYVGGEECLLHMADVQVRKSSMARILCDNSGVSQMQPLAFQTPSGVNQVTVGTMAKTKIVTTKKNMFCQPGGWLQQAGIDPKAKPWTLDFTRRINQPSTIPLSTAHIHSVIAHIYKYTIFIWCILWGLKSCL